MVGLIMVVLGVILIILGFFFTISGSRKLSGVSAGPDRQYREYGQYGSMYDHDNVTRTEGAGEDLTEHGSRSIVKGGGVIMIGPIPIIFGSGWKSSEVAIILTIVLMLLWFFLFR